MRLLADLHVHSRFSRGTSPKLSLETMSRGAKVKGLDILGTGDFTHPAWMEELKSKLKPSGFDGIYSFGGIFFVVQTEVSLIFSKGGSEHRIHLIVLAPSLESADQISETLSKWGDLNLDGRPTLKVSAPEFVEAVTELDPWIEIIPAHVWTPWYSLFGSRSGFDSVEEAFGDQAWKIHALETGLSSDPPMNWMVSQLDRYSLVSFSDAHSASPRRLGREATAFDLREPSYRSLISALRGAGSSSIAFTVEVDPAYGKYHFDGHRTCGIKMHPREAEKRSNLCPVCGKPLTVGVLHRVLELADRPEGYVPEGARPFIRTVPLHDLLGAALGLSPDSPRVEREYLALVRRFGTEFSVILNSSPEGVSDERVKRILELARAVRSGEIEIEPGYDGVYGRILIDRPHDGVSPPSLLDYL